MFEARPGVRAPIHFDLAELMTLQCAERLLEAALKQPSWATTARTLPLLRVAHLPPDGAAQGHLSLPMASAPVCREIPLL